MLAAGKLLAALLAVGQLCLVTSLWLQPARNHQLSAGQQTARYELKFQNEPDNSTTIKRELQQQIFKCQVRLAPFAKQLSVPRARFRSSAELLNTSSDQLEQAEGNGQVSQPASQSSWPTNVTLFIDWFKGDQQLGAERSLGEPVSVINVELKSNGSSAKYGPIDKKNKPRLEIKNTLNGSQLKLTSRLKLSQLKANDSGQYKCIARALFQTYGEPAASVVGPQPPAEPTAEGLRSTITGRRPWLVQQRLESNAAILVVANSSASAAEQPEMEAEIGEGGTPRKRLGESWQAGSGKQRNPASRERTLVNDRRHAMRLDEAGKRAQSQTDSPLITGTGSSLPIPRGTKIGVDNDVDDAGRQAGSEQQATGKGSLVNQFEDDEDLSKMDARNKFISGTSQLQANDDDEEEPTDRRQNPPSGDPVFSAGEVPSSGAVLDWRDPVGAESGQSPDGKAANETPSGGRLDLFGAATTHRDTDYYGPRSVFAMDAYLAGSLDSTRLRLAKFVHKIAPELSCYTGSGEHYRGNVSTSRDGRVCLDWALVRGTSRQLKVNQEQQQHNNCRNPNLDKRGPWCYVQYDEQLDGPILQDSGQDFIVISRGSPGNKSSPPQKPITATSANHLVGQRYVHRQCSISACSEYLWFYIVAPPLGFLVLLSCLVTILVRSMRKSHYNSIFSVDGVQRSGLPKFRRLLKSRGRFAPKKLGSSSGKKARQGHYSDDDFFEIVDDLDWSDGQTQSLSPKSTESLKLTSSFSSSSHDADSSRISAGCKSTNPIFCPDKLLETNPHSNELMGGAKQCTAQQVGPMFATLRCHIRGKQANQLGFSGSANGNNKSSTFIEQCDLATSNRRHFECGQRGSPDGRAAIAASSSQAAAMSLSTESQCKLINAIQSSTQTPTSGSHLISYGSSSNSAKDSEEDEQQFGDCSEKFIIGNELPKLDASSVAIALEQQQPLYEGKFSQVQLAYINEPSKQADINTSGRIGAQVAVCWLKSNVQSNFDTKLFSANRLRLRNLNHLNLLKLIGYAQLNDEIGLNKSFTLVYDMAQLVDLSDWLKQQSNDIMTSCEPGTDFGVRRNLTCFAKQIALALDYLHDKDMVYKDLACRNCFLDPTKMLVKLASFNLEPIINNDDNSAQNLRSMIRPKYLLDYYVIDSRPSDCQLLPLSWIPLESILFNKFNKQTDVWSFGCLIYELFSLGEVAYFGYSSKQVIDAVRSNLTPPQPLLCPNGIYKLMCKCLSDIPTIRPNVKQIYELLNLYSGQCSSFLDHHLCSLDTHTCDDHQQMVGSNAQLQARELMSAHKSKSSLTGSTGENNSITKTKSYANIRNFNNPKINQPQEFSPAYHNLGSHKAEAAKLPLSKSINMGVSNRSMSSVTTTSPNQQVSKRMFDSNHYDEPIIDMRNSSELERGQ